MPSFKGWGFFFLRMCNFGQNCTFFDDFLETSIELRFGSNGPNGIKLEAFESSLSIFFDSWKRYSGRPIWPEKFSWKLRNLKIFEKIGGSSGSINWSPNSDFQSKMLILRKYITKPFECDKFRIIWTFWADPQLN